MSASFRFTTNWSGAVFWRSPNLSVYAAKRTCSLSFRSAISVTAQVDAPALSPGDFQAHNIRFMQAVKVAEFTCHFAGTRNSEGSMTYRLKEPHINTFILDCVTGQNFQPRAYPFFNVDATDRISGTYLARLDDAPGFNTATRENNSVTSRWNYL